MSENAKIRYDLCQDLGSCEYLLSRFVTNDLDENFFAKTEPDLLDVLLIPVLVEITHPRRHKSIRKPRRDSA